MRQLSIVVLFALSIFTVGAGARAQSDNRYGASSQPPKLPDIATAFDNTPPPRPGAASRYGAAASPPALPPSTPVRPRNESRPVTPLRGGSVTSQPITPIPPRPAASPSRASSAPRPSTTTRPSAPRAQPSTSRPSALSTRPPATSTTPYNRFQPRRSQPSGGVSLPENDGRVSSTRSALNRSTPTRSTFGQSGSRSGSVRPPSPSQRMMANMLTPRRGSQLRGTPVTVAQVTRGAATRDEQSHRVEAYWDLCASVADYYLGLWEEEELRAYEREAPAMSDTFRLAAQDLRGRLDTSLHAAQAGQRRLASMMGTSQLPLPSDAPFCGEYDTRFGEIFGSGGGSSARLSEARGLHELLPARYGELQRTASSIARAEKLARSISARSSGSDGKAMLRALELLALNRRAFVQLAKDYNRRIARYTELSNPGRVDNNLLVAMLVGSSERVSVNTVASLR